MSTINPFKAFKRNQTRDVTLNPGGYSPFILGTDGKVITARTVNADTALKNSDIFSVINLIASDISACDFIAPTPFKSVLDNPNNLMNEFSFWQSVVAQLCLAGNAYVSIKRDKGVPVKLEQIPINQVQITLLDDSKDITYTVHYTDGRDEKVFKSADMLHFKLFVTGQEPTQYVGISPLDSLVEEMNLHDYSNRMTLSMLKNAIAPSYTLTVPQGILDEEAKENIRGEFEKANAGDNAGRAIVLDQGLELKPMQISPDVAKLLSNTTFSQTQIAKAFGISDSYLNGSGDEQSSVKMIRNLFVDSLGKYMQSLTSELTMKFGVRVKMDIESAVDIDNTGLINQMVSLTNSSNPVLSGTQARRILAVKGVFDSQILAQDAPSPQLKGGETNDNKQPGNQSNAGQDT